MNLNKRIVVLILLIILFVLLIVHHKSIESFLACDSVNFVNESAFKAGFCSVVSSDDDNEDSYDLDYNGPKCLATCVMEHGVNPNFTNPHGENDIFKWHKQEDNIGKGYCFNANDREFPYRCDGGNCKSKCTLNLIPLGTITISPGATCNLPNSVVIIKLSSCGTIRKSPSLL